MWKWRTRTIFSGVGAIWKWRTRRIVFWSSVLVGALVTLVIFEVVWMRHRKREAHMAEGLVKNPPWLMWGNSQTIELESNPINAPILTQQLVRIAYKRPENWTFLFYAELLTADPLPNRAEIDIDFNLTTGVGRSQVSLNSFEHYDFDLFTAQIGDRRYSTTVLGPDRSNLSGTIPPLSNVISEFPGQDIQLNTTIRLRCLSFAKAVVRIDAYFAPKVHIRPEWFKGNMAQEEDEGH